jgi:hypothetical protein
LLILYQAFAQTVVEWEETLIDRPPFGDIDQKVINQSEALTFVDSLASNRARIGLRNFITRLRSMNLPQEATIDLLFCCRLLAPCFENYEGCLDNILSGAAARHEERMNNDYEYWLSCWFGKPEDKAKKPHGKKFPILLSTPSYRLDRRAGSARPEQDTKGVPHHPARIIY